MITMYITNEMYLSFCFYVLPRASYVYIQCEFIPSVVWRFSIISSSFSGYMKLNSNRHCLHLVVGICTLPWQADIHLGPLAHLGVASMSRGPLAHPGGTWLFGGCSKSHESLWPHNKVLLCHSCYGHQKFESGACSELPRPPPHWGLKPNHNAV